MNSENVTNSGQVSNSENSNSILSSLSRRGFIVAGAGTAGALTLAACSTASTSSSSSSASAAASGSAAAGTPKTGGKLSFAMTGGGSAESLNPSAPYADIDLARTMSIYDRLVHVADAQGVVKPMLAESMTPNADGTEWTIKLRSGVTWHDGSPFTADDVIYTFKFDADPNNAAVANFFFTTFVDTKNLKKVDDLTLIVPMIQPVGDLAAFVQDPSFNIFKNGTTNFDKPNGTGPFKFVSWTPGQSSLFARNTNYWAEAGPYIDELELVSIPDATTRLNALLSGQVDAAANVDYASAKSYESQGASSPIQIVQVPGWASVPFTMGTATKPFSDPKVRQAFRLLPDREAMIQSVNNGYGQISNDLFAQGDPLYNNTLPQRVQDIEQAKSLLKSAGYEGLTIELSTSPYVAGMTEAAQVLAQQAKAAGVTINVKKLPAESYYTTTWPNYQFGQTVWGANTLPFWTAFTSMKGSIYNDTQWQDEQAQALATAAVGDPNPATAKEKFFSFQEYLYNNGTYIFWGTGPQVDAFGPRVANASPAQSVFYDYNGVDFTQYWVA